MPASLDSTTLGNRGVDGGEDRGVFDLTAALAGALNLFHGLVEVSYGEVSHAVVGRLADAVGRVDV